VLITDPGEAIFAPAIGLAAGRVVGEVIPGVAVAAVIFAHRAPLTLAQIGPPLEPGVRLVLVFLEPLLLRVHPGVPGLRYSRPLWASHSKFSKYHASSVSCC